MIDKNEKDIMLKKWEGVSYEDYDNFVARVNRLGVTYAVIGKEICPTTGRPHNQFYLETKNRIRISTIGNSKHLNCAIYPLRREVQKAIDYIIANPEKPDPIYFEIGTRPIGEPQPKGQGKVQEAIEKREINLDVIRLARVGKFRIIAHKYPGIYLRSLTVLKQIYADSDTKPKKDNIQCIRLLGSSGTGKTQFLKKHFRKGCYFYNKKPNFFERYSREKTLVIDDLDRQGRHILNDLKVTCDTVPLVFNVKYGSSYSHVRKIIITSQYSWESLIGRDEHGMCNDPELLEALTRRFTNFTIMGRDENTNDVFVCFTDDPIKMFPFSLRNYLLSINFI